MNTVPAALALAALAVAALVAERIEAVAVIAALLLVVCLRAPERRGLYLTAALASGLGVLVLSPFLAVEGYRTLWSGPHVPVLGVLDVTVEEVWIAARNGLRLCAVGLAFAAYALLLDHDALLAAASRFARRSALAAALATRLVPTLERDARGLREAVRGRGVELAGVRGHARLLSPLVASSLERASSLAEAMEARGFGRAGATRAPRPSWTVVDQALVGASAVLVAAAVAWL